MEDLPTDRLELPVELWAIANLREVRCLLCPKDDEVVVTFQQCECLEAEVLEEGGGRTTVRVGERTASALRQQKRTEAC